MSNPPGLPDGSTEASQVNDPWRSKNEVSTNEQLEAYNMLRCDICIKKYVYSTYIKSSKHQVVILGVDTISIPPISL